MKTTFTRTTLVLARFQYCLGVLCFVCVFLCFACSLVRCLCYDLQLLGRRRPCGTWGTPASRRAAPTPPRSAGGQRPCCPRSRTAAASRPRRPIRIITISTVVIIATNIIIISSSCIMNLRFIYYIYIYIYIYTYVYIHICIALMCIVCYDSYSLCLLFRRPRRRRCGTRPAWRGRPPPAR